MKKLTDFKNSKVDLKEIQGGTYGNPGPPVSGFFIPDNPSSHPDGPGKMNWVHADFNVVRTYY